MASALGCLVFFVPGFVIPRLSKRVTVRTKSAASAVMAVGVVLFAIGLSSRG
jgi:hypothetical protein